MWPLPQGLWVAVLVYCLSAVIFIKLWGQMQSDAMALLWKVGLPTTLRRRPACLYNEPFTALRDLWWSLSLTLTVMKTKATAAATAAGASHPTNRPSHWNDGVSSQAASARRLMETGSAVTTYGGANRRPTESGPHGIFFLKSRLIYHLPSVYLFSNRTKWNSHRTVPTSVIFCACDVGCQVTHTVDQNLKSGQGFGDLR